MRADLLAFKLFVLLDSVRIDEDSKMRKIPLVLEYVR